MSFEFQNFFIVLIVLGVDIWWHFMQIVSGYILL